ncbi:MAG: carbon-nitrogen hydrolase [Candidatus Doudnabacteria bacterium]|nr:carbon-nitrogen hydrolase [Candidatus Doudnabacteria bacterium]
MKNQFITIGLMQTKVSPDIKANVEKTLKMIAEAAKKGARIIAMQELFQTPYFPQWEKQKKDDFAESLNGYTVSEMQKAAKKFKVTLVVPIYERKAGKYLNTAIIVTKEGKIAGQYHKVHIPHDPGFYEKEYFEHGQEGYKIFTAEGVKFAVLICYDQWFPEAAREARLAGAQIIFYPTAIGHIVNYNAEGDWHDAWETIQRSHAIANSVYVAAINRTGREGKMQFWGQSFISDPFGKILKRASEDKEEVIVQKLDLERNEFYSEGWGFLRNRRPDTYKNLVSDKLIKKSKTLQNVAHYKQMKKALEK